MNIFILNKMEPNEVPQTYIYTEKLILTNEIVLPSGELKLSGDVIATSAGQDSNQYLEVRINGQLYKIKLLLS